VIKNLAKAFPTLFYFSLQLKLEAIENWNPFLLKISWNSTGNKKLIRLELNCLQL
jgi:hypothetical protein